MLLLGLSCTVIVPLVSICIGIIGLLAAGRAGARNIGTLGRMGPVGVVVGVLGVVGGMAGPIIGVGVGDLVGVKKLLVVALMVLGIIGPMTVWGGVPRSGLRLKALFGLTTTGLTGLSLFLEIEALGLRLTLNVVWGRPEAIPIGLKVGVGRVGVGLGLIGVGGLQFRELLMGVGLVLFLTLPAIPRF